MNIAQEVEPNERLRLENLLGKPNRWRSLFRYINAMRACGGNWRTNAVWKGRRRAGERETEEGEKGRTGKIRGDKENRRR